MTTTQIRAEIDSHLQSKVTVENSLPQFIVIGPFHVDTDSVRLALAKKHRDIARALLDFMVVQLREETEEVRMCVGVTGMLFHMQKLLHFGQNRFLPIMVHIDMRIKLKLAETALLHHLKGLFMLITMVQIPASYLIQMHGYVMPFCMTMAVWSSEIC